MSSLPAAATDWLGVEQSEPAPQLDLVERIRQDMGKTARDLGMKHRTQWCAEYLNSITGGGTGSAQARSWLNRPRLSAPEVGSVVVLKKGSTGQSVAHVGVVESWDDHWLYVIGGNQGHRVSISRFSRRLALAYVEP